MRLSAADVDFGKLTDLERETLDEIIPKLQEGYDVKDIAHDLGADPRELQARVDDLGAKLMALAGAITLPPLSEDEYDALKTSLAEHGQQMPILRGSPSSGLPGQTIDGVHRRRALAQLKVDPVYKDVDGTADQLRSLGVVLNLARRQLSATSRRGIVKAELLRDGARSDRAIALLVGVDHKTVATVRRKLEERGEVGKFPTRTGRDGVAQPATARGPRPPATERTVKLIVAADMFEQLVGPWVTCKAFRLVERRPGVHELQVQLLDPKPISGRQASAIARDCGALAVVLDREQADVVGELLANASEVFGRPIVGIDELYVDEADWVQRQLETLRESVGAPA